MNTTIITQAAYIESAVNELLLKFPEWCSQFEHRVRIERAERIAKQGGIESLGENRYAVPSERNNGDPYIVNRSVGTCECPDYRKHLFETSKTGWKCKHRIAAYLTVRAAQLEMDDHAAQVLAEAEAVVAQAEIAESASGLDTYAQVLDQLPAKPKRKYTRRKKATTADPVAVIEEIPVVGTWDIAITGEIVHVCADGYNTAPIMGVGAELWCHRCNERMPHVLMTRESRAAYNYVSNIAIEEVE